MKKNVRTVGAVVAASLSLVLAACGGSDSSSSGGDTIKIGVVLPYTGVQAKIAEFEGKGVETAVKEINAAGGIDGKKIELVKEDDKLDATKSASVMRDLKSKGVQVAIGGQTSDLCKAYAESSKRLNITFVGAHCTSSTLVDPPASSTFYMTGQRDIDLTKANGAALAKQFPNVKTWDVFAYDQDVTKNFWTQTADEIAAATGAPVKTNKEVYVPAAATDLRNQLSSLAASQTGEKATRGLFLGVYGAGTTSFIQQARPLGLLDDYAVIAQTGVYWSTAVSLKGTAPSIYDVHEYFWSCQNNPENSTFVKGFEALAGEKPDTGAYQGYVAIKLVAAAIEKAGKSDSDSIQKAMGGVSVMTPAGLKMTMDGKTHHADGPITTALLSGDKSAPESVSITDCHTVLSSAL